MRSMLNKPRLYLLLTYATRRLASKVLKQHPRLARPVESALTERHISWQRPGPLDELESEPG
jgi:hypothetical protein